MLFLTAPLLAGLDTGDRPVPVQPIPTATETATPETAARPYRAVWVSYLEWQEMNFSSEAAFTACAAPMLDDIAAAGATVVLVQVRPFGDALYPSDLFPFSHLCSGTQGIDPGFDPLAVLVAESHARGLELEAWLNPYRLQVGGTPQFCDTSPAILHPDWVRQTADGLYFDPANPAVRQYIADGIAELCERYPLDGIHFDDYFYPTTDPAFDTADYPADLPLEEWRRQNVDELVSLCWQTAHRFGVRFGIAPQGDLELNYSAQYSDVAKWLSTPGYCDYLMPQLYWGIEYTKNGSASHSLTALAERWAALPRAPEVALYAGLGAYRVGAGDGSDAGEEWFTGHALSTQVQTLASRGITGIGLYRYGSLWGDAAPPLAEEERQHLSALWRVS